MHRTTKPVIGKLICDKGLFQQAPKYPSSGFEKSDLVHPNRLPSKCSSNNRRMVNERLAHKEDAVRGGRTSGSVDKCVWLSA